MPRGGSERENLRITRNSHWQTVETDAVKRNDYDSYNFPNINRHQSPTEGSITQEDSTYGFDNNLDAAESKLIRIQPCNVEDYSVSKKKNQRYFFRKTQSGSKTESKLFKNFAASTTQSRGQKDEIKNVINECNYQSEQQNKPLKIEIKRKFRDYNNYLKRFDNHVGVLAKIPSCHIDEPFTEDIEARYEYRSQMDLKATQFKLSVARQCKKYAQACDGVNQRKRYSL